VTVDLEPFGRINVCGYPGLTVTRLKDLGVDCDVDTAARGLTPHLLHELGLTAERGLRGESASRDQSAMSTALQALSSR
jgi:lipoate-protein ligase B